jgi:hypothetical protein
MQYDSTTRYIVGAPNPKFTLAEKEMVSKALVSIAVLPALFWGLLFWNHAVTNYQLFWLPSVNILGVGLVLYVDQDTAGLVIDAKKIDGLKYEFKKV